MKMKKITVYGDRNKKFAIERARHLKRFRNYIPVKTTTIKKGWIYKVYFRRRIRR